MSRLQTVIEEQGEDEGQILLPLEEQVPQKLNQGSVYFNIASLFAQEDETHVPQQFLDNAKNTTRWSSAEDNKLVKAFQKYENNWSKIQEEV